jgi:hypothetical protein
MTQRSTVPHAPMPCGDRSSFPTDRDQRRSADLVAAIVRCLDHEDGAEASVPFPNGGAVDVD